MGKTGIIVISAVAAAAFLALLIFTGSENNRPAHAPANPTTSEKQKPPRGDTAATASSRPKVALRQRAAGGPADKTSSTRDILTSDQKRERLRNKQYRSTMTSEEKIDFLQDLLDTSDPRVVDFINQALDDQDNEVRSAAAGLLEEYAAGLEEGKSGAEILPLVQKSSVDPDESIRERAVAALREIKSDGVEEILAKSLNDSSETVRDAVFDVLSDREAEERDRILKKGLSSPFPDVKNGIVEIIESSPSKTGMDILIEGLKDNDPELRGNITEALDFLLARQFNSYEEAKAWWEDNKSKYDNDLFEADENEGGESEGAAETREDKAPSQ